MQTLTQNSSFVPFTPTLPAGYKLHDYIIEDVLGQGAFGITYSARDILTNYPVVIKENFPIPRAYRDPISGELRPMHKCEESYRWAQEHFERTATLLHKLPRHNNIVHVTNVFRKLNTTYCVMEKIEGELLANLYPVDSQMEPQLLGSILRKLLFTLDFLHQHGLLHRNINPSNIILTPAGEPVLLGFAALHSMADLRDAEPIGTPGYAPPEQFTTGSELGPWTDIYALGATCYYLLTGQNPPYCLDRMTDETHIPLALRPELQGRFSPELLASIDKAFALRPTDRWQSAQEWMAAIDSCSNTTATPVNGTRVPTIEEPAPTPKITQQAAQAELQRRGISAGEYDRKLYVAAENGETELVKLLTAAGADVNKANIWDKTPLYMAAVKGHTECVKLLLAAGADVNKANEKGETPLYKAAWNGRTECVKLLIAAGADVNKANACGQTPLYTAAENGHTECVKLLIAAGADVNKVNIWDETPLFSAAWNGHTECVKLLLDAPGIDLSSFTPLSLAVIANNTNKLQNLLAAGADINRADKKGKTPLFWAANMGHTECVKLLIAAGADVNKSEEEGEAPLYMAAWNGRTECVKLLIAAGADVNKADEDWGRTPLYQAAWDGHTDCVKLLLAAGADVNKANKDGETPLYKAADNGHTECVKLLIDAGADVNKADYRGYTPLYWAALWGHTECVKLLIDAGADVNKADKDGYTPLFGAAFWGNTECVKLLIAAGADVNKANEYGETPLSRAAYNGHTECVKLLIAAGADVNKADKEGKTPLYKAEGRGHTECAELLRAAGGNTGGI